MQKFTPCLWFNGQAEEAARFYTSIFRNSRIETVIRYGETAAAVTGQDPESVMTVAFVLDGQPYLALNGGPQFTFTPALSLIVNCETQEEVDTLWEKLSEGGQKEHCGWLRDRYGVSWQIVPTALPRLIQDPDTTRRERVMQAMFTMSRIDITALEEAHAGK